MKFRNSKYFYYILFIIFLSIIVIITYNSISFAAYPKLVNKITSAFEKIKSYIVEIATPAAAVAIGAGFMMQKFSFGDEERIRTGKKLIRTSFVSYAFILLLDMIINLIETLVS